jgi:hypothetical protein
MIIEGLVQFRCNCGYSVYAAENVALHSTICPKCGLTINLNTRHPRTPTPSLTPAYNHWLPLHQYAVTHRHAWNPEQARRDFDDWQTSIPNIGCGCMDHWRSLVASNPPRLETPEAFFEWAWSAHETVNARINKKRYTLNEAKKIHGF